MAEKTDAIVLRAIKYGDTSIISTCYTKTSGIKSYMLKGVLKSKKNKIKAAYFQPLMLLQLTANHNRRGALNTIKDVGLLHHYQTLQVDIKKQSIVIFLSEILYSSIREESQNLTLFSFLEHALVWLDNHENIANFHLLFLLNLTKYLGFYPQIVSDEDKYFDLSEGRTTTNQSPYSISSKNLTCLKQLIGINFDDLDGIVFSTSQRQKILTILIQYFELHLIGFNKPYSLQILSEVFRT